MYTINKRRKPIANNEMKIFSILRKGKPKQHLSSAHQLRLIKMKMCRTSTGLRKCAL